MTADRMQELQDRFARMADAARTKILNRERGIMPRKNGSRGATRRGGKRQQSKVHRELKSGRAPTSVRKSAVKKTGAKKVAAKRAGVGVHGAGMTSPRTGAARPGATTARGTEAATRTTHDAAVAALPPGVSSAKGTEGA